MANAVDIVRSIVDRINRETKVISVAATRVYVCSTLHITVGKIIEDENGNEYTVTAFEFDNWIEVKPKVGSPDPYVGKVVIAPKPLFYHGTPSSVNAEYLVIESRRTLSKTPFIWMLESYEYENMSRESSIEMEIDARLFFMSWADVKRWLNDDHNQNAIKPMENLVKGFREVIEDDYSFKTLDSFTSRPRSRFGVEVTNKGNTKTIIDEDLSGIDVRIALELFDVESCIKQC